MVSTNLARTTIIFNFRPLAYCRAVSFLKTLPLTFLLQLVTNPKLLFLVSTQFTSVTRKSTPIRKQRASLFFTLL